MVDFFTTAVRDFEPGGNFVSIFSNRAEVCSVLFVLLSVWLVLRQTAFLVKFMSQRENEKNIQVEFCVSAWDSVAPKLLYSLRRYLFLVL